MTRGRRRYFAGLLVLPLGVTSAVILRPSIIGGRSILPTTASFSSSASRYAPTFFLVLHFATTEDDGDLDLVVVLEEFERLVGLGLDVVVARLGTDTNLLQLLLTDLGALLVFVRILETHLAVIEDTADGGSLLGGHLYEVEIGLLGLFEGQGGHHHAQLFPIRADQADRADANLLIDSRATIRGRLTIEMTNTRNSFVGGNPSATDLFARALSDARRARHVVVGEPRALVSAMRPLGVIRSLVRPEIKRDGVPHVASISSNCAEKNLFRMDCQYRAVFFGVLGAICPCNSSWNERRGGLKPCHAISSA